MEEDGTGSLLRGLFHADAEVRLSSERTAGAPSLYWASAEKVDNIVNFDKITIRVFY